VISRSYQGAVKVDHFVKLPAGTFAFAVDRDNQRLRALIDQALERIADSERLNILRRWTSGSTSILLIAAWTPSPPKNVPGSPSTAR
jgi:two-component system sensor histidine kinase EvgS